MATGRPSKYSEAYCNEVISYCSQGYSLTAFAGSIGVSRDSLYEWADKHEAFSDALKIAQTKSAIYWEDRLRNSTSSAETTAAIFALKNRVAKDWRDKVDHEHAGANGGPISFAWQK